MLYGRLAELGGPLLVEAVAQIEAGTAARTPRIQMGCPLPPCCPRSCPRWTGAGAPRRSTTRSGAWMAWPRASTDVLGGEAVKLYRSQVLEEKRPGPQAQCWAAERLALMCCAEMARCFALQSFRRLDPGGCLPPIISGAPAGELGN